MSEQVSSFLTTEIGKKKYLFYITAWSDFQTEISDALDRNWENFGEALGTEGKIIKPYASASHSIFEEVLAKDWSSKIRERMEKEQDPFMVVTKVDWKNFSPKQHGWAIIWFSEFQNSLNDIPYALSAMSKLALDNDDLIQHLNKEAARKELAEYSSIIEIKPGLFGCSIDLKAGVKKLMNILS